MRNPRCSRTAGRTACAAAAALLCGTLTGAGAYAHLAAASSAEAAALTRVTATVTAPAAPDRSSLAIGHWPAPDGTLRGGIIPAPPGKAAGDPHQVWVDERGRLAGPPATAGQRTVQAAAAGAAVGTAAFVIIRRRSRRDPIDAEWRQVAGDWQRHR